MGNIIYIYGSFQNQSPVGMEKECHGDMTGKRGGGMSKDELCLVNLQDISSFGYV